MPEVRDRPRSLGRHHFVASCNDARRTSQGPTVGTGSQMSVHYAPTHPSTMPRHTTQRRRKESNPPSAVRRFTGFEDREGHQPPFASAAQCTWANAMRARRPLGAA